MPADSFDHDNNELFDLFNTAIKRGLWNTACGVLDDATELSRQRYMFPPGAYRTDPIYHSLNRQIREMVQLVHSLFEESVSREEGRFASDVMNVLEGFTNRVRSQRKHWEREFAAELALEW